MWSSAFQLGGVSLLKLFKCEKRLGSVVFLKGLFAHDIKIEMPERSRYFFDRNILSTFLSFAVLLTNLAHGNF